jgi:predicted transglutaminase-like cysteine proteinase
MQSKTGKFWKNAMFIISGLMMTTANGMAGEIQRWPVLDVVGSAKPPIGWVEFCRDNKGECQHPVEKPVRVVLAHAAFAELDRVNRYVNLKITPATDMEVYGVPEKWAYPVDRGDCEDYVLLKRRMLIDLGWPVSSLLITVVRDEHGDGHAVLTVATDRGDFIADNQRDDIRPWQRTGYKYIKRQSQGDERQWVFVGDGDPGPAMTSQR